MIPLDEMTASSFIDAPKCRSGKLGLPTVRDAVRYVESRGWRFA